MSDTLILNASYEPLSVLPLSTIPWQRTMKLLVLDRISVLAHYDDWIVRSQKLAMPVPALAITKEYFDFKKAVRYSKSNIYLRDLYTCQYCGDTFDKKDLTIDHVIPRSHGGKTTWDNCVAACNDCNLAKGNKMVMKPLRQPFKPDPHYMAFTMKDKVVKIKHPSWEEFLTPYHKTKIAS